MDSVLKPSRSEQDYMTCKLLTALFVQKGYNINYNNQVFLLVEGKELILFLFLDSKYYTVRSFPSALTVYLKRSNTGLLRWKAIKCNDNEIRQRNRFLSTVQYKY